MSRIGSPQTSGNQLPRFRPSAEAALALLQAAFPAPVETAHGAFHVHAFENVRTSTADASAAPMAEVTRTAIGERVERMLATLGFDAGVTGEPLLIADDNGFTPELKRQILLRLPAG